MKKPLLALLATTLLTINVKAQDEKKFRLGLEICPNMAWLKSDVKGFKNDGSPVGFRFGLLGDFRLGGDKNYYFSTGVFMNSLKGKSKLSIVDSTGAAGSATLESKFQYVELPLSIKLKTDEIGYITYFGQIGFDTGLQVQAKARVGDGDFEDVSDHANIIRVALLVGGGLEYNFSGGTSALLGLKYSNAFTSVNDGDGDDVRLHYFEITVGALF
jgi:opacity protein-like surface antigen